MGGLVPGAFYTEIQVTERWPALHTVTMVFP